MGLGRIAGIKCGSAHFISVNSNQSLYRENGRLRVIPLLLFLLPRAPSSSLPCAALHVRVFLTSLKIVKTYRRASVNPYLYIVHTHVCEAYGRTGGERQQCFPPTYTFTHPWECKQPGRWQQCHPSNKHVNEPRFCDNNTATGPRSWGNQHG